MGLSDNRPVHNRSAFAARRVAQVVAWLALAIASAAACAADRVALVVGNNQYPTAPLRNAANDARDLAATLRELGFQVILRENASRKDMIEAVREFGQALDGAQTALFFYAGHAMQFKDRNYLIPIDAAMGSEEDVTFFSVELGQLFDRMERARTRFNFIILDACRDNPFASTFKVSSAGLAQISAPSGTLIAYATAPGSVAADGGGRNGIYTKHILQNIKAPDLPAEIMFKRVREGVERETRRLQTPWDSSSLKGDFVFNPTGRTSTAAAAPSGPSADATLQIEREFWISVRDSNRPEDIQAYLDKYPSGNFTALARNRLDSLLHPVSGAQSPVERVAAVKPAQNPAEKPAEKAAERPLPSPRPKPPEAAKEPAQEKPSQPAIVAAAIPTAPPAVSPAPKAAEPGKEISPGVRELTFADGSIYRGATRGGNLHGKGEYVSKTFKYEGEFNEGLKQGRGVYVWDNGDRYEGLFAGDRPDGDGKYQFANGDRYEGQVSQGAINGRGVYVSRNGDTFEGPFASGKLNGVGVYRFASGDRYEGEMSDGRIHGKGRYVARNGDVIEGRFIDGKPDGIGTYRFSNGDRYEGEIVHGVLSGQGVYFYASGLKYEGEVREGRPQGKGVFWFLDGTRFEGQFEEGLKKARGELVTGDGTRAPAEIVEGNARLLN